MDIIQKLSLEIDGISGTVREYTSKSYIDNILNNLEKSIESKSPKEILYCMNKLVEWYNDNQQYIQTNEFVFNKKIHQDIHSNLYRYIQELEDYNDEGSEYMGCMKDKELDTSKVFVVHGHDDLAKTEVARFIEKLGLKVIILHEQASSGKTIIEKIEEYSNVGFGIVIYTPCDVGNSKNERDNLNQRARQNVVFEHGYLMGKIGRPNVCALVKDDIEKPNDISGVVYIEMDKHNAWQLQIAKEMKNIGYEIDLNCLI